MNMAPRMTYSANFVGLSALVLATPSAISSNFSDARQSFTNCALLSSERNIVANSDTPQRLVQRIATRPILDLIESYANLHPGWDGAGSVTPSLEARQAAKEFIRSLAPSIEPPTVTAAGDGEISLSWRSDGAHIDVSFIGTAGAAFAFVNGTGEKVRGVRLFTDLPKIALVELGEI